MNLKWKPEDSSVVPEAAHQRLMLPTVGEKKLPEDEILVFELCFQAVEEESFLE